MQANAIKRTSGFRFAIPTPPVSNPLTSNHQRRAAQKPREDGIAVAGKVQLVAVLDVVRVLVAVPLDRIAVLVVEEDERLVDLDGRLFDGGVDDLDRGGLGQVNLDEAIVTLHSDEDGMGHGAWLLIGRRTGRPQNPSEITYGHREEIFF